MRRLRDAMARLPGMRGAETLDARLERRWYFAWHAADYAQRMRWLEEVARTVDPQLAWRQWDLLPPSIRESIKALAAPSSKS